MSRSHAEAGLCTFVKITNRDAGHGGLFLPAGRGAINDCIVLNGCAAAKNGSEPPDPGAGHVVLHGGARLICPGGEGEALVLANCRCASLDAGTRIGWPTPGSHRPLVAKARLSTMRHVVRLSPHPVWRGETQGSYFLVFKATLIGDHLDAGRTLDPK